MGLQKQVFGNVCEDRDESPCHKNAAPCGVERGRGQYEQWQKPGDVLRSIAWPEKDNSDQEERAKQDEGARIIRIAARRSRSAVRSAFWSRRFLCPTDRRCLAGPPMLR